MEQLAVLIERHGLWSDDERRQAKELRQRIETEKLELIRLAWADPHGSSRAKAVTIPAFSGPVVLVDAGANPEPRATHLWQYGVMADAYARAALKIDCPRIAQMNIGSEEAKGTGIIKQTRDRLRNTPGLNYIGYIEGRDFFDGAADVVVTDGFVGNTLLKMAEGLARSLFAAIAHEIITTDPDLAMRLEPVGKSIYRKNDYHEHGGAPLLGVNGAVMIAHGSSEARTIRAAIRRMREFIAAGINEAIVDRLAEVSREIDPALLRQVEAESA